MENHNFSWVNPLFLWPFFLFFVVEHGPSCVFFASHGQIVPVGDPFAPRKNEANQVAVSKIRVKLEQPRM